MKCRADALLLYWNELNKMQVLRADALLLNGCAEINWSDNKCCADTQR